MTCLLLCLLYVSKTFLDHFSKVVKILLFSFPVNKVLIVNIRSVHSDNKSLAGRMEMYLLTQRNTDISE